MIDNLSSNGSKVSYHDIEGLSIPDGISNLTKADNRDDFLKALYKITEVISADELNGMASQIYRARADVDHKKPSNWSSGATPSMDTSHRKVEDEDSIKFFVTMFEKAAALIDATLSRNNLFHAHCLVHKGKKDFRMVFHSYEYPSDIEELKSKYAHELDTDVKEFESTTPNFKFRNVVYSSNLKQLIKFDQSGWTATSADHAPYNVAGAIGGPNNIRLEEDMLGDFKATVNYFPKDDIDTPFFTR